MDVDYDRLITFWLKDVPYFWGNFENERISEKSFFRTYILINDENINDVSNFFDDVGTGTKNTPSIKNICPPFIKNYFNRVYRKDIILQPNLKLRINGNDVTLPLYYSKRNFSVGKMYSYLGINIPKEISLRKYPIVKRYIPDPTINITKYSTPSNNISQEKYVEELIDVYIGIFSEIDFISKHKGYIPIANPKDIHPSTTKSILQNSLFVTLDVRNGKVFSFNKKFLLKKAFYNFNIKFIFIPFIVTNVKYTHAKLLIINKRRENIYIFDPFGKENKFPGSIERFFKNISIDLGIPNNFKIINEEDYCPINSFQYFEESEILFSDNVRVIGGYCSIWVFWFINFLLNNSKINYKSAHYLALNELSKNKLGFQNFIKSYHNSLSNNSKKIIKELGLKDIREYSTDSFKIRLQEYIYKIYLSEKVKLF